MCESESTTHGPAPGFEVGGRPRTRLGPRLSALDYSAPDTTNVFWRCYKELAVRKTARAEPRRRLDPHTHSRTYEQ